MMKKIATGIVGLLLSASLYAGDYDGVWVFDFDAGDDASYFVLHQNGKQLLVVDAWQAMDGWSAHLGTLSGSSAEMRTIVEPDGAVVKFTLNFSSQTRGTITLHSCSDGCGEIPVEQPLPVKKFF